MSVIYLDNANATKVDEEVVKVMEIYFKEKYGIPGGEFGHKFEEEALEALEKAREIIAKKINAEPNEIIFTSGDLESNNLAIFGYIRSLKNKCKIVTSKIEQRSILDVFKYLEKNGYLAKYINVDNEGFLNLEEFERELGDAKFASIQFANKEIGTIQDMKAIVDLCKDKNVILHCDASHAFCKVDIDVKKLDVDILTLSSTLIHGPKGISALYVKDGLKLEPLFFGDARERGIRPGFIDVAYAVGFAKAVQLFKKEHIKTMKTLRDYMIKRLLEVKDSELNGPKGDKRLCNNVNISFKYVEGEAVVLRLSMKNVIIGTGSACYSPELEPSHVILALGKGYDASHSSLRIVLSKYNNMEEIKFACDAIIETIEDLRRISPWKF